MNFSVHLTPLGMSRLIALFLVESLGFPPLPEMIGTHKSERKIIKWEGWREKQNDGLLNAPLHIIVALGYVIYMEIGYMLPSKSPALYRQEYSRERRAILRMLATHVIRHQFEPAVFTFIVSFLSCLIVSFSCFNEIITRFLACHQKKAATRGTNCYLAATNQWWTEYESGYWLRFAIVVHKREIEPGTKCLETLSLFVAFRSRVFASWDRTVRLEMQKHDYLLLKKIKEAEKNACSKSFSKMLGREKEKENAVATQHEERKGRLSLLVLVVTRNGYEEQRHAGILKYQTYK